MWGVVLAGPRRWPLQACCEEAVPDAIAMEVERLLALFENLSAHALGVWAMLGELRGAVAEGIWRSR